MSQKKKTEARAEAAALEITRRSITAMFTQFGMLDGCRSKKKVKVKDDVNHSDSLLL